MHYFRFAVIFVLCFFIFIETVHAEEVCEVEVLSSYGYEPEGVVHEGEYAVIYLIYPGKTGKDIDRVKIKAGDESISVGMLDMLFNNFDKPVSISGFKVKLGVQDVLFTWEVLLPPKSSDESPYVGCFGQKNLKVVKTKKF